MSLLKIPSTVNTPESCQNNKYAEFVGRAHARSQITNQKEAKPLFFLDV